MNPKSFIAFFLGGMLYALIALSRSKAKGESFDPAKLMKTLILAGFLAAANALSGSSEFTEMDMLIQGAGETVLLDKALKALISAIRESSGGRWLG